MFKHMRVAVDGSTLSDTAYRKALELARPLQASITAMQVVAHYDVMRLQAAMLHLSFVIEQRAAQVAGTGLISLRIRRL